MSHQPAYVWALILIGVIGIPAATAFGLFTASRAAGRDRRAAAMLAGGFAAFWTAWIVASALLADAGAYGSDAIASRPWFGVAAGGALVVAMAATRIPAFRRLAAAPGTLARLTWPHALRVIGVVFILVMALGKLPAVFALPAGLGDIAVGLEATVIARRLARGDRTGAIWFNILGLLDLVVAVSIGLLAGLGPRQLLDVSPSTVDLALLPLVLVPTTAVPLLMALHVTALVRLRAAETEVPAKNAGVLV